MRTHPHTSAPMCTYTRGHIHTCATYNFLKCKNNRLNKRFLMERRETQVVKQSLRCDLSSLHVHDQLFMLCLDLASVSCLKVRLNCFTTDIRKYRMNIRII